MRKKPAQVAIDERAHVGVGDRGRGSLELPDLGRHLRRYGHRKMREVTPNHVGYCSFVGRIAVGMQEADGDGLDAFVGEIQHLFSDGVEVGSPQGLAVARHPLAYFYPPSTGHQRSRVLEEEVVDVVALLAPHLKHVLKAAGGEQRGFDPTPLYDRVGH
jgi:hypothetical protein